MPGPGSFLPLAGLGEVEDRGEIEDGLWALRSTVGEGSVYAAVDEEFVPPDWPIYEYGSPSDTWLWGGDGTGFVTEVSGVGQDLDQALSDGLRALREQNTCRVVAFPKGQWQEMLFGRFGFAPAPYASILDRPHQEDGGASPPVRRFMREQADVRPWETEICSEERVAELFPDVIDTAERVERALQAPIEIRVVPEWFTHAKVIPGGREDYE